MCKIKNILFTKIYSRKLKKINKKEQESKDLSIQGKESRCRLLDRVVVLCNHSSLSQSPANPVIVLDSESNPT